MLHERTTRHEDGGVVDGPKRLNVVTPSIWPRVVGAGCGPRISVYVDTYRGKGLVVVSGTGRLEEF